MDSESKWFYLTAIAIFALLAGVLITWEITSDDGITVIINGEKYFDVEAVTVNDNFIVLRQNGEIVIPLSPAKSTE